MKDRAEMVPITARDEQKNWNQMKRRVEMVPITARDEQENWNQMKRKVEMVPITGRNRGHKRIIKAVKLFSIT